MKILFLTPQVPYPPRQGTALRNFHLIESLAELHFLSLLSFLEPGQANDPAGWGPLNELCQQIETVSIVPRSIPERLRDLVRTSKPDMALRLWSQEFAGRLATWLKNESFDIVHIEGIELAPYLDVLEQAQPRPLMVFDNHNAEYVLQHRAFQTDLRNPLRWHAAAYSYLQWRRLQRFEAQVCLRADRVIAVSETDARALQRLVPDLEPAVISNCIDTVTLGESVPVDPASSFDLLFTGKMDFRPNIDAVLWFAREIWPLIQAQRPETSWGIVGKSPHARLEPLREDPRITITGEVADIRPYFQGAKVYVIPLRVGGGTRFKLLEAAAAGTPVVSTTVGAEGVPVQSGREVWLADNPAEFAAAVLRLFNEPALREQFSTAARQLIRARFDWRVVLPQLEQIYQV